MFKGYFSITPRLQITNPSASGVKIHQCNGYTNVNEFLKN